MRWLLGLGIGLPLIMCAISAATAEEQIVQKLSANGSRSLRPFEVKPHWEIRWDSKQGIVVAVMRVDADPKDPIAKLPVASGSQMTPGSGSTYVEPGGHYYLQITSMGDWTITVVQLP